MRSSLAWGMQTAMDMRLEPEFGHVVSEPWLLSWKTRLIPHETWAVLVPLWDEGGVSVSLPGAPLVMTARAGQGESTLQRKGAAPPAGQKDIIPDAGA